MELAQLNTTIGGNIKPLQAALSEAKAELTSFARTGSGAFDPLSKSLSATSQSALKASTDLKSLQSTLILLGSEQSKVSATNIEGFNAYQRAIQETKIKINELKAAQLAEVPAIKAVTAANVESAAASNALSGGLTTLKNGFSFVRQAAYLLPGIGIAGIFNLAFEAISSAATALGIFGEKASVTAETTKQLADGLASGAGSAAEESAHLNVLASIAADVNIAMAERLNAVKRLQETYPQHLGNLSKEAILTGNIADQLKLLNDQILNKALAQAAEKNIGAIGEQLFKINQEIPKQLTLVAALQAQYNKLASNETASGREGVSDATVSALTAVTTARTKLTELYNTQKQFNDSFVETIGSLKDYAVKAGDAFTETDKKIPVAKVKALKEAYEGLQRINLSNLTGGAQAPAATHVNTPVNALTGLGDATQESVRQNMAQADAEAQKGIEKINATIQKGLTNTFENLAESLGEAIGNVFTGKQSPFEALGRVLGQGIKALGAQLIKLGFEAKVIQTAIKSLLNTPAGPIVLIAGGIALEAIGTAVSNLGIQQHAEGGIFDKPTMIGSHLFGEKGPEALIPLNRLSGLMAGMGGGNGNMQVTGHIELGYDKLLIGFNRAQRFAERGYGNFFSTG